MNLSCLIFSSTFSKAPAVIFEWKRKKLFKRMLQTDDRENVNTPAN
jgi:hypothetical protein